MKSYEVFKSMDSLLAKMQEDKSWEGAEATMLNRYPIRFILFDNFNDLNEFVERVSLENVLVQKLEGWLEEDTTDTLITYSELALRITEYIKHLPTNDFIIVPFSEIARFYNNDRYKEFDSLINTIRLIESPEVSQYNHQRLYIPLIGMQGKMGTLSKDPNIHIWEYRTPNPSESYRLIMTRGTDYGVQGLHKKYSQVNNIREWLNLWNTDTNVKHDIISTSIALYNNSSNAQPDNAFSYIVCSTAFEFLTKGLGLDFGTARYTNEDALHWEELASHIDVNNFNLDTFVNQHFGIFSVSSCTDFINTWLDCNTDFDRWLLSLYYKIKYGTSDYLGRLLVNCDILTQNDLFSNIATEIFYTEILNDRNISDRYDMLSIAADRGIKITEEAEQKVKAKLCACAADLQRGYYVATKLLTPLTDSEKRLIIEWLGEGKITQKDIKDVYPPLSHYLAPLEIDNEVEWLNEYFENYRKSKICNKILEPINCILSDVNCNATKFHDWYDSIKTVKTILSTREDIDIIYWVDGLGVDWIPFIKSVITQKEYDGIYLNEIFIARSELPSCTENNKIKLKEVAGERLKKIGDLDCHAHMHNKYPNYIIEEFKIVECSIKEALAMYSGKKIAFVSDHGISYLSQYKQGLKLAGVESDHNGRLATISGDKPTMDNKYIILQDDKTLCALTHASLCGSVPIGTGSHGGATPEEVLVPIIVVSSQKNSNAYTIRLLNEDINGSDPIIKFEIKGLSTIDSPELEYNDVSYKLKRSTTTTFESERINLVDTCKIVVIKIGEYRKSFPIKIKTGVIEDDLFGDINI